ncbi:MAG: hypothetical protein IT318_20310 [Anaerolineales bacterium]|nr:hypothetical protein [Anaerolineales bacterium]
MVPREEIIAYARKLAGDNRLDPEAFVQAVSAPMGPLAKYEQDGDFDALMDAMEALAASGNIGASTGAGQERAVSGDSGVDTSPPPPGDGTSLPEDVDVDPSIARAAGLTPGSLAAEPTPRGRGEETNPFQQPSPDVVDPSVGAAARQPKNIPVSGTGSPFTQPMGVAMGMEGVRNAPFGAIPFGEMNPYEREFFFPFMNPELGGASQAAENLARMMGYAPQSGNPWSRHIAGAIEPLASQASIVALLNGQISPNLTPSGTVLPDMGAIVPMVQEALQKGQTTVFGEGGLPKVIGSLKQLAASAAKGEYSQNPGEAALQEQMADPATAARMIESLMTSAASPYQRRQLRPVLQEQMGNYFRQAPNRPTLGPFDAIVGGFGY